MSDDSIHISAGDEDTTRAREPLDKRLRFWDLKYRSKELELAYAQSYFENDIGKTRIGLISGAVVLLMFAIFEPYLLETNPIVNQVRLLFVMPLIVICLIATFSLRDYLRPVIVGVAVLATLSQIAMLPVLGAETATNTSMAYLQYILFTTVLLFQPFRYLVLPVVGLAVLMTIAIRQFGGGGTDSANYEMASQSISFIALLFAYLREQSQRQLFAANVEVDSLRDETERQQTNQINWLRNLSRYLEHELRNHVFILQSNLEYLQQDSDQERDQLVRRALRSVAALSDLCDSVGEASTLEAVLQADQIHLVNFSRMVTNRVLERSRDLAEVNPLELAIDPDLWVSGSEVRLLQVFDHLLNNALEYSSEEAFVRIEVKSIANSVYFTVHNRGEPLPRGRDIFAPFESTRPKTSLGLGLYVSHKIIEHHGGTIEARTQLGQTIVMVTLPQVDSPIALVEKNDMAGSASESIEPDRKSD